MFNPKKNVIDLTVQLALFNELRRVEKKNRDVIGSGAVIAYFIRVKVARFI